MAPLSLEIAPSIKVYAFDFPLTLMYASFFTRLCMRRIRVHFESFDFLFLLFFIWITICAFHGRDFATSLEWIFYRLRAYLIIF